MILLKMEKNKKFFWFFLVLLFLMTLFFYIQSNIYSFRGNMIKKIELGGKIFRFEIVDSPNKMVLGLSGRKKMCLYCGMLFVFSENKNHSFWMKNMKFPLDIIWLEKGIVKKIEKNIPADSPHIFSPNTDSDIVLEINGGIVERLDIKEGDFIFYK